MAKFRHLQATRTEMVGKLGQAATSARAIRNGRISSLQEGIAGDFGQVLGVMVGCQLVPVRLAAGLDQAKQPEALDRLFQ